MKFWKINLPQDKNPYAYTELPTGTVGRLKEWLMLKLHLKELDKPLYERVGEDTSSRKSKLDKAIAHAHMQGATDGNRFPTDLDRYAIKLGWDELNDWRDRVDGYVMFPSKKEARIPSELELEIKNWPWERLNRLRGMEVQADDKSWFVNEGLDFTNTKRTSDK